MNINSIKQKIEDSISESRVEAQDTTGTGDHFSVVVVSDVFDGMSLIDRHKLIYKSLEQYITREIHALQIKTYTKKEIKNV